MLTKSRQSLADTLTTYYFRNRAKRREYLKTFTVGSLQFVGDNIAFDLDLIDEAADMAHSHALKLQRA